MSLQIGPALPPEFLASSDETLESSDVAEEKNNFLIGPVVPPNLLSPSADEGDVDNGSNPSSTYGPALPPELRADDGDNDDHPEVGPSLVDNESETDYMRRLLKFREINASGKKSNEKREEWMTQLPDKLRSYGLGARTFSRRGVESNSEDRSAWTDDPADKRRKLLIGGDNGDDASEKKTSKSAFSSERDKDFEEQAKILNKNRTESLLDMHSSGKHDSDSSNQERRPFDRDKDLKTINLTKMDKDSLKKKAVQLSGRFSHGGESKFL